MAPWISAAKNRLIKSIDNIKRDFSGEIIELSFVGYRDVTDEKQFVIKEFTTDYDDVVNTIRKTHAKGGGDMAEDVTGAYRKVCEFNWNADVRVLFHVCDAPNHGSEYHSRWYDDAYPEGLGSPTLKDCIKTLALKNVDVNFLKLNDSTDIMVGVMKSQYNTIRNTGFSEISGTDQGNVSSDEVFERGFHLAMTSSLMTRDPE